jgi:WD40 repeat protein
LKHPNPVRLVSFSPDGRYLLTLSRTTSRQNDTLQGEARVWDCATGRPVIPWISGVHQALWFPDGRWILTSGVDRTSRVWDVFTASPVVPFDVQRSLRAGSVSRDGTKAAVWESSGASLFDLATGRPASPRLGRGQSFEHTVLSPDNSRLLALGEQQSQVFDLKASTLLFTLAHPAVLVFKSSWGFSPDGHRLLIAGGYKSSPYSDIDMGSLMVWDVATGKPLSKPVTQTGKVESARFSTDSRRIVTAARDGKARVYDSLDCRLLLTLAHRDDVNSPLLDAEFDPDGRVVVTAGMDGTVRVWDATTGKRVPPDFRHEGEVHQASFSPDGRDLLTAGHAAENDTGVLRVWNFASRAPRTPLMKAGSRTHINSMAAFSPDGRLVVAVDDWGARVWDAATGEVVTPRLEGAKALYKPLFSSSEDRRTDVRGNLLLGTDYQNRLTLMSVGLTPESPLARVWELPTDHRTADELVSWVQLLASRRIDATEALVALTQDELTARVNSSRKRGELTPATTRPRAIDWDRFEAEECEMVRQYYGAAWHLSRLIEARPSDPGLRQRRGNARAVLADWQAAADDYRAAVQAGATDPEAFVADARLRLACHNPEGYREACAGLIGRFGESDDLPTLVMVARVLALSPQDATITKAAVRLAERAVEAGTRAHSRAECDKARAAILIRAGRLKEATETMYTYKDWSPWCKLFTALGAAKGGEIDKARTLYADASKRLDDYTKAHSLLYADYSRDMQWPEFLDATLLKGECERLIEAAGPQAGAKP